MKGTARSRLEYTRLLMELTGADFRTCAQEVAQSTVFTTHTPVDAGTIASRPSWWTITWNRCDASLGLAQHEFLGLGRIRPEDHREALCMTVLAFKMSRYANGVSALHGRITRKSWQVLAAPPRRRGSRRSHHERRARAHLARARDAGSLRQVHGRDWRDHLADPRMWAHRQRPDAELWETHRVLKAALVRFVRRRVSEQRRRNDYPEELVSAAKDALDPEALTIGFARRFATYKRASLIFHDMARLKKLITNSSRPLQIVFSGKAHPADRPGQEVLRQVHEAAFDADLKNRVVFIEDYDINVGRHLVQGVDVWLNNPRRPQEASGTSGQKLLLNGGLNFSVLDGWWAEAYDGLNGFAIGDGITHVNVEEQDRRDAASLYDTLENMIVPLYYERDDHGMPRGWVERMKRTIRTLGWRFNTDRMVIDYANSCYLRRPARRAATCGGSAGVTFVTSRCFSTCRQPADASVHERASRSRRSV